MADAATPSAPDAPASSSSSGPVNVVFGAGGGTGLACVQRLLQASDLPVRAVVRSPEKYADVLKPSPKLQVVAGDVTDVAGLPALLAGARGVIFAASGKGYWTSADVDFKGVANVAAAAKAAGAQRVVLVSSGLVTLKHWLNPLRMLLNNIRWRLMDYKLKGENALRASGVSYTIVRPGGLTREEGGSRRLIARQGDSHFMPGAIPRADVANVCVEALTNPDAHNVTLEVAAEPKPARAPAAPAPAAEGSAAPAPAAEGAAAPAFDYAAALHKLFSGLKQG